MKNAEGDDILVPAGADKVSHYHPNLPLPNSPVFRWPPRPVFVVNWFRGAWLDITGATLWTGLAVSTWLFL